MYMGYTQARLIPSFNLGSANRHESLTKVRIYAGEKPTFQKGAFTGLIDFLLLS